MRAEFRLTVAEGIAVSEEGKALDQGREGGATVAVRGVGHSRSEKGSSMVTNEIVLIRYFEAEFNIWL